MLQPERLRPGSAFRRIHDSAVQPDTIHVSSLSSAGAAVFLPLDFGELDSTELVEVSRAALASGIGAAKSCL